MIYLLKKSAGFMLSPYRLALLLALVGMILLWFTRRQKTGRYIMSVSLVTLIIASVSIVSNPFLGSLEDHYHPLSPTGQLQDTKWVVVLSGGAYFSEELSVMDRLSSESLIRLAEGIRLLRLLRPSAKMILSGGDPSGDAIESHAMSEAALALGITTDRLMLEDQSYDTKDQARFVKKLVGQEQFILVTSANHMPRAIAVFEKQGTRPIPAPVNTIVKSRGAIGPLSFVPDAENIRRTERALYEYVGTLWARLRGQI